MTFGEKLQRLRKARGCTQEELAEKVCVSRQSLSKWESDGALPDTAHVIALADLFGVTTDYLLRSADHPPEPPIKKEAPAPAEVPPTQTAAPVVQLVQPQKKPSPPATLAFGYTLLTLGLLVLASLFILSIVDPTHFYKGTQAWSGLQGYIRANRIQWLYYGSLAAIVVGVVTNLVYHRLQRWYTTIHD